MNRRKKSGFLTFCFSLIPGAGEMYLGFMKMGVSLMGLFFAVIVVGGFLNVASVMLIDVIVWFYSFFHVHNLAGMPDEEFLAVEDEFLFRLDEVFDMGWKKEKYRKIVAVISDFATWKDFLRSCFSTLAAPWSHMGECESC